MRRAFIFLIVLLPAIAGDAQVIHFPADYATIQAAINASSDGDTVLVDEGTYYENIFFKGKAITVASRYILDQDAAHDGQSHNYCKAGGAVGHLKGSDCHINVNPAYYFVSA